MKEFFLTPPAVPPGEPDRFINITCCSVVQLCLTLCHPMDCSIPGFPVLHHLPEFAQTQVHWVGDAIQLSSTSPPAFNLSQHQGLFQWVGSLHQAHLSSTSSWSLLKFMSIEVVMLSNHFILCCPLLSSFAFNISQYQGLFQWVSSLHQVAKLLELQLQHQSFQGIHASFGQEASSMQILLAPIGHDLVPCT